MGLIATHPHTLWGNLVLFHIQPFCATMNKLNKQFKTVPKRMASWIQSNCLWKLPTRRLSVYFFNECQIDNNSTILLEVMYAWKIADHEHCFVDGGPNTSSDIRVKFEGTYEVKAWIL